jgi:hypothetical protein
LIRGGRDLSGSVGIEIEAAKMEVDCVAEVLSIPIAAGHRPDPLDPPVERFGAESLVAE